MKRTYITFIIVLLTLSNIFAQRMGREKFKLLKTSYITEAIELTPNEAEKFWPVYNLYSKEIYTLKKQLDSTLFNCVKPDETSTDITEKEAEKAINNTLELERKITDTKHKMTQELRKIISAKQLVLLKKAERDFNRRILSEYGRRKRFQK